MSVVLDASTKIGSMSAFAGWSPDPRALAEEMLHRRVAVDERHDDVSVPRRGLLLHDHEVAVVDPFFDHRLSAHAQREDDAVRHEPAIEVQRALVVFFGEDRLARRDVADERHADDARRAASSPPSR
jgi:hypothetical protein